MKKLPGEMSKKELGTSEAVLEEFNRHRLPRLLSIQQSMEEGKRLQENDLAFLKDSLALSEGSEAWAKSHPEFRELVAVVANLYREITRRALENEKTAGDGQ